MCSRKDKIIRWLIGQLAAKALIKPLLLGVAIIILAVLLAGCQLSEKQLRQRSNGESKAECDCGEQTVVVHISTADLPKKERVRVWRWFKDNGQPSGK